MRVFIQTYGCQMNEADSEAMSRLLGLAGYQAAARAEEADVVLLNTCCVRAKPEQKVRSRLGELRLLKQTRPTLIIGVSGCMAQKEGERLLRRMPFVDLVVGTREFHRLPDLLAACREGRRIAALGLDGDPSSVRAVACAAEGEATPTPGGQRAGLKVFVPVILGCDNFCAYCIVPFVRGRQKSRPVAEVVAEVTARVSEGAREVTLLGQSILAYGRDLPERPDFSDLLCAVDAIEGIERIRFTTAHPRDVDDRLIDAVASLPRVCEHFHLPIQSGDDRVLSAMGRGYTVSHYLETLAKIRARMPDVAVTTDIMVGFPGETDEEAERSLQTYREAAFDQAFTFIYSSRPGTRADALPGQVPYVTKQSRLARLVEVINATALHINQGWVGREAEVLVDGVSDTDERRLAGRLRNNKLIIFSGSRELIGQLVPIRVTSATLWGLYGEAA